MKSESVGQILSAMSATFPVEVLKEAPDGVATALQNLGVQVTRWQNILIAEEEKEKANVTQTPAATKQAPVNAIMLETVLSQLTPMLEGFKSAAPAKVAAAAQAFADSCNEWLAEVKAAEGKK